MGKKGCVLTGPELLLPACKNPKTSGLKYIDG